MPTETTPSSQEVKPLDFSKIEDLFEELGRNKTMGFEVAGKELSDDTSIMLFRHGKKSDFEEDEEVTFEVRVLYRHSRKKLGRGVLSFELTENGLEFLSKTAVDLNREPFGFDVSVGEFRVGRWLIHGEKAELSTQFRPGSRAVGPQVPKRESNVKAGELMIDWLREIIDADSFSEPTINLTLLDPKTIRQSFKKARIKMIL